MVMIYPKQLLSNKKKLVFKRIPQLKQQHYFYRLPSCYSSEPYKGIKVDQSFNWNLFSIAHWVRWVKTEKNSPEYKIEQAVFKITQKSLYKIFKKVDLNIIHTPTKYNHSHCCFKKFNGKLNKPDKNYLREIFSDDAELLLNYNEKVTTKRKLLFIFDHLVSICLNWWRIQMSINI